MSGQLRKHRGETILGGQVADQLKGYVLKLESLDREIQAIDAQKSRIYRELRAAGLSADIIKKIVRERKGWTMENQDLGSEFERYKTLIISGFIAPVPIEFKPEPAKPRMTFEESLEGF